MNASTNKLSTEEIDARRRLLFSHANANWSEREFEQYVYDLRRLVHVPDELVAEAMQAHLSLSRDVAVDESNNDTAANTTNNQQQTTRTVTNPYAEDAKRKEERNKARIAWGSLSSTKTTTNKNNNTTSTNKKNGPGRPVNSKNKPGHGAGGDRKSIKYKSAQFVRENGNDHMDIQSFLIAGDNDNNNNSQYGSNGNGGGGGGGSGGGGGGGGNNNNSDDEDDDEEERVRERERQRKIREKAAMSLALEDLDKYANSFPNGTIEETPDNELSDDDSDDDESFFREESNNNTGSGDGGQARRSYKPKAGPVKDHVDGIIQQITSGTFDWSKSAWIPPPFNPMSKSFGSNAKPDRYYLGNTWVYVFDPMKQYRHLMPQKQTCIKCKSTNTKYNGNWDSRPCHMWDNIIHIVHRTVVCNDCNRTFPTLDAAALATLPTPIAEQFPFMMPNERGPGLYAPMLLMMVSLMPHSILYGTFANVINNLQRVKFAQTHILYLDMVDYWINVQPPIYMHRAGYQSHSRHLKISLDTAE